MTRGFALPKRLAAEDLCTGLLVATVVGSGLMAEQRAEDNAALVLLGKTIQTGAILVELILRFGPISGTHFNPAVSRVMGIKGGPTWREAGPYCALERTASERTLHTRNLGENA